MMAWDFMKRNETEPPLKRPLKVFMSYVRADQRRVEGYYSQLKQAGFDPWMDVHHLLPGEQWRECIGRAIRSTDVFLAFISWKSVSRRGFLQKEIRQALDIWNERLPNDIYLIPVRLEECEVPESLRGFHYVDIFQSDGWSKLLGAIQVACKQHLATRTDANASSAAVALKPRRPPRAAQRSSGKLRPAKRVEQQTSLSLHSELPVMTFPRDLTGFLQRIASEPWGGFDEDKRRFFGTLGTKLEPMVQVVPQTPIPLVIGFECLALGALGENFASIKERSTGLDPGILRLALTLVALKTVSTLRTLATQEGNTGAHDLVFTINLDPEMLDCPWVEDFLDRNYYRSFENVLFEVNERTSQRCLRRLKELQADFGLRYCADDVNNWRPTVRAVLEEHVEMTKLDRRRFQKAMKLRGDQPKAVVELISSYCLEGKPLVVEGVEDRNHLRFLREHWPDRGSPLFGQGYIIEPGHPWDGWTGDLRRFGLPGGHFLANSP